jgi:MoxR-like ATPase
MHAVAQSMRAILDEVSAQFLERRSVVEAILMAVLAKEHAFILGPPGTAKSQLTREIIGRFEGAEYFEVLLSKQRPDAAVLGPYDLPLLRTQGTFKRKDTGFLTTAHYAMLDEIGKSSPTLGHDLLAALNERVKHEVNGQRSVHDIPLHSVIAASNELIVQESEDAAALWDRLLVRTVVDYIQESGNFAVLLQSAVARPRKVARTTVKFTDLTEAIHEDVPAVEVPVGAIETVLKLRDELRAAEITPSDRRWRQCVRLLQASAFLNGRSQVEDDDLHVLRYALWDGPEQIHPVERMTLSLSNPTAEACLRVLDDAEVIAAGIRDRKGQSLEARAAFGTEANGKVKVLVSEANKLRQDALAAGRSTTKVDEVLDRLSAVRRSVYVDCLDMDPSMIR